MRIKDDFHHLIDTIEDENVLKAYYQLIQSLNDTQTSQLWNKLSPNQKQELLLSYEESFDDRNLITNDEMKQKHLKWLKK